MEKFEIDQLIKIREWLLGQLNSPLISSKLANKASVLIKEVDKTIWQLLIGDREGQ